MDQWRIFDQNDCIIDERGNIILSSTCDCEDFQVHDLGSLRDKHLLLLKFLNYIDIMLIWDYNRKNNIVVLVQSEY